MENDPVNFEELIKKIKLAIGIFLVGGGSYLGLDTFLIVKSVLIDPGSLKKWVELRPAIMIEPNENLENSTQKALSDNKKSESNSLTLWVIIGYFSIVLGIFYSYILVKISLGLLLAGITILTDTTKKESKGKL